eukprot:4463722-Lingulodinium_polyedra.AAC.1
MECCEPEPSESWHWLGSDSPSSRHKVSQTLRNALRLRASSRPAATRRLLAASNSRSAVSTTAAAAAAS